MTTPEIPEFPLPDFLKLTPKRLAENEANQKSWRESAGSLSSAEAAQRARSVLIEADARNVLAIIGEQFAAAGEDERISILHHRTRELGRLAEALAAQGRYDEAAAIEPSERKAAEYAEIWEAVWREDEETCKCPSYRTLGNRKHLNDTHALDVFSLKHGRDMALVKCGLCEFANVRPLTQDLIDHEKRQEWKRNP